MEVLERNGGMKMEAIKLKQVGLRDMKRMEEESLSNYVTITQHQKGEMPIETKLMLEGYECYFIMVNDNVIGKIEIEYDKDECTILLFMLQKDYHEQELQNQIIEHIKTMYPEAKHWN
ncbi:hypothetical protein [Anaeromicropila herbilytica]|uniref:Uncharacterized protein n=1 Tax=Anaeromicropila herbilytica TaxID=2785025 RepID=A0A7R7EK54_9FIRM|nr:hypothetical protein [Anaeromicropila herbilytica]BCN30224.1 hypothetical protein bsdtb5_15190 [Anaeromicropila herbilytica]